MDKIFCMFPLFVPTEYYLKVSLKSIQSFVDYVKNTPNLESTLQIVYAGWVLKDEHWEIIKSLVKNNLPEAEIYRLDKNYGKSFIVNQFTFEHHNKNPNSQFLFTMDSDIQFIGDQPNTFPRLLMASEVIQKSLNRPFGAISLNQQKEQCHWIGQMDQNISYTIQPGNMVEEIIWSTKGDGIAGGAMFLNLKAFVSLGGYRFFNYPYGGDEAFLLAGMLNRGYHTCISKNVSVIHEPTEGNEKYIEWKKSVINKYNEPFSKEQYLKNVESSMEFWKNYEN